MSTPTLHRPSWIDDKLWDAVRDSLTERTVDGITEMLDLITFQQPTGPCPAWCSLDAAHTWDGIRTDDGRCGRWHDGPHFGEFVFVGAYECQDTLGQPLALEVTVTDDVEDRISTPEDARDLAARLVEAAAWIEAHA